LEITPSDFMILVRRLCVTRSGPPTGSVVLADLVQAFQSLPERYLLNRQAQIQHAIVDQVVAYPEYPSDVHPMRRLADLLTEPGLARGRLGADWMD
jgi:hypothetical protein